MWSCTCVRKAILAVVSALLVPCCLFKSVSNFICYTSSRWSKSRHVTFTKSGYFPHEAILPPFVYINSASMDQYYLHVQFDFLNNS